MLAEVEYANNMEAYKLEKEYLKEMIELSDGDDKAAARIAYFTFLKDRSRVPVRDNKKK